MAPQYVPPLGDAFYSVNTNLVSLVNASWYTAKKLLVSLKGADARGQDGRKGTHVMGT